MSVQNPTIPTATNPLGIDLAINDLQSHLDTQLTWLTNGMGRAYRMAKVETNRAAIFLPEVYLGTDQYKYFAATPDNDKQAQSIILAGNRGYPSQQLGFYGWKEFDVSIIFNANLKTINSALLETDKFTEHLIIDVENALIRDLLGRSYRLTINSVTEEFEEVYAEFDVSNDRGIQYAPMTHFRFNCTMLLREVCTPAATPDPPLTDLVVWLKADAGVNGGSVTDGAQVSTWADQSGNANDFSQAVLINQPTYKANAINGLPAIEFTAPQYLQRTLSTFLVDEASIYIVYQKLGGASGGQFAQIITLSAASFMGVSTEFMTINDVTVFAGWPSNSYYNNWATAGLDGDMGASDANPTLLSVIKTTTGTERFKDYVSVGTGTGAQTMNGNTNHYIGSWFNSGRTIEGLIPEILIYDKAHNATERGEVFTYIQNKHAI